MIFDQSLRRELTSMASSVFAVLCVTWMTIILVRTLGDAAGGRIGSDAVLGIIAFATIKSLPIILVVTLFISVLMVVTRAYRESEMVVWLASGASLLRWIPPVLRWAAPIIAFVGVLSLAVTPWATRQIAEYKERFEKRDDVSKVAPGQFRESGSADRVFFVESLSSDLTRVQNVFVRWLQAGRTGIMAARTGSIETMSNGDRFLVLHNGRRYETGTDTREARIMEFERYGVQIETTSDFELSDQSMGLQPTGALVTDPTPRNLSELLWRIALPLMALNFTLIAIPLAFVNPRAGRSASLLIALLAFFTYINVVTLVQSRVAQEVMSFGLGWWVVHAVVFALMAWMFWQRVSTFRLRDLLGRRA